MHETSPIVAVIVVLTHWELSLKENTCETRKNVFYFTFCSDVNQTLTFQIFKCHYVIKCPSMKHETYFTE